MALISLISIIQKNFKLPIPQCLGLWFSRCQQKWNISIGHYEKIDKWLPFCYYQLYNRVSMEMEYHQKTGDGDAYFLFSEFSISSFFPITHSRFHFNIYAWLHLKHLCVVYATSHLCVVSHFLIFCVMVILIENQ